MDYYFTINSFTYVALITALAIFTIPFIGNLIFERKINMLKKDRRFTIFFSSHFYKIPVRYFGISLLFLFSLFRRNEKAYLRHAFNEPFDNYQWDQNLIKLLAKEKHYHYAIFTFYNIHYFQKVSFEKEWRAKKDYAYPGFLGWLRLHADSYKPSLIDDKLFLLQRARFDLDSWIPPELVAKFIEGEPIRLFHYRDNLKTSDERELQKHLENGLAELSVETRNIVKRPKKRFNFSKE